MKTLDEIKTLPRLQIVQMTDDGCVAYAYLPSSKKQTPAVVVCSNGGGWDHVSVSFKNRCPTWEEMCDVKNMFFRPEETCWEYHPMESEYVNQHPYCLHIWRYQLEELPTPPSWMIGAKKGQTTTEAIREGVEAMRNEHA